MFAALVVTLVLAQSSFTPRCAQLSGVQAERALALLTEAKRLAWYEPLAPVSTSNPFEYASPPKVGLWPQPTADGGRQLTVNSSISSQSDVNSLYLQLSPDGPYQNLGARLGCPGAPADVPGATMTELLTRAKRLKAEADARAPATTTRYEVVGASSAHVMLREHYRVDECCGGREAAACRYAGEKASGEGVRLRWVTVNRPARSIESSRTFPIYDSVLDSGSCTPEPEAARRLDAARRFAADAGVTLDAAARPALSFKVPRCDTARCAHSLQGELNGAPVTFTGRWSAVPVMKGCDDHTCTRVGRWEVELGGALSVKVAGEERRNLALSPRRFELWPAPGGYLAVTVLQQTYVGLDLEWPQVTFVPR